MEDVIWLKLKHRVSDDKLNICLCYLLPDRSSRKCDAEAFFTDLMTKVYEYQNEGDIIICGDFNARCGDESDYIECVDNVPPREVIDHKLNSYGQLLLDFLVDCNLYMINGRTGENDFTNINTNGSSVVDYIIVPHEQLHKYYDFKVHTMTSVINSLNLHGHNKTSEHSILQVVLRDKTVKNRPDSKQVKTTKPPYNVNDIPVSFLNCETSFRRLSECIGRIEKALQDKNDVQSAYAEFMELLKVEMESKLKPKKRFTSNMPANKSHKSKVKSYWNSELQFLWDQTGKCEKLWLANKRGVNKNKLKQEYCLIRKQFDKLNRKCKRRFQLEQQQLLQDRLENRDNPRDFWAKIGRLGLANDRRTLIPWEVKDENGCITTDKDYVLSK